MGSPPRRNDRTNPVSRWLIPGGIALCAAGLLGPVLAGYLPADGFPITSGSVTEGFFRIVPAEDSGEHLEVGITVVGIILLCAGVILRRRGR